MESVVIKISGMTCGGCTSSVTNVLQDIDGVNAVEVTLEPGQASVDFDPAKTTLTSLQEAIEGAGFDVVQ
ncbi:MAG: heavy-metal-associated domain-containing protein [Gammaproteobacteria bacterium]|nr:heavy-metal-associated domain-containing protein [Gammaproteobacteria bacterium]